MAATGSRTIDRWSPWMNAWTGLSLPGVGLAVLGWGPRVVLAVAAIAAFMVAVVLVMGEYARWREGNSSRVDRAWACRILLGAVAFIVSTLWWTQLGPGAFLLVPVVGATIPPAVDVVRRVLGQTAATLAAPTGLAGVQSPTVDVLTARRVSLRLYEAAQAMSDSELCRAWRRSYWSLREASDPVTHLAVVLQRQSFLDEMEARHDAALHDWLASGARASAGPERFLQAGGSGPADERRSP